MRRAGESRRAGRAFSAAAVAALMLAACGGDPAPSPVRVTADAGGLARVAATGIPDGHGRVLTVAHVLRGARSLQVSGRPARVLRVDAERDLAVLGADIDGPRLRHARGGDVVELHLLSGTRSVRVLRRVTATLDGASRPALELAARVLPGDSGAPVTDNGRLVGMVFARGRDTAWAVALG